MWKKIAVHGSESVIEIEWFPRCRGRLRHVRNVKASRVDPAAKGAPVGWPNRQAETNLLEPRGGADRENVVAALMKAEKSRPRAARESIL